MKSMYNLHLPKNNDVIWWRIKAFFPQEILRDLKSGIAGGLDGFHQTGSLTTFPLYYLHKRTNSISIKEQIEGFFLQEFKFSALQRAGWAAMFWGDWQMQVSQWARIATGLLTQGSPDSGVSWAKAGEGVDLGLGQTCCLQHFVAHNCCQIFCKFYETAFSTLLIDTYLTFSSSLWMYFLVNFMIFLCFVNILFLWTL